MNTSKKQKIWFTADTHFFHSNILKYTDRPFTDTVVHDDILFQNWNGRVAKGDIVYVLGDFSFGNSEYNKFLFNKLNGCKHLIRGNHDRDKTVQRRFQSVSDIKMVKIKDEDAPNGTQLIVCCHYAMKVWPQAHYGAWHLYGHSHGNLSNESPNTMDVGVDNINKLGLGYFPIEYNQIKDIFKTENKEWLGTR